MEFIGKGTLGMLMLMANGQMLTSQGHGNKNSIKWEGFPKTEIVLDSALSYIGAEEYVLFGATKVNVHLFAEVFEKKIERLCWIQFEENLPFNNIPYDYSGSQKITTINNFDYYDDFWIWNIANRVRKPGSDVEHVMNLIEKNGLKLGPEIIEIRWVRLDKSKRKELMLIFIEDLEKHGLNMDVLTQDFTAPDIVSRLENEVRERAFNSIQIKDL